MKLILFVIFLVATAAAVPSLLPTNTVLSAGGEDIDISEVPWLISLELNGVHSCGGSIISQEWVLTAAQCTDGVPATSLAVRAGSSLLDSGSQLIPVHKIVQHPSYERWNIDNDVSVVQLDPDLKLGFNARPVNLPYPGKTWDAGLNVLLQGVTGKIISQEECQSKYPLTPITDRMLCADVTGSGKACQGDPGSPLVEPIHRVILGVVSWGQGPECVQANNSGVYTNVAKHVGFILNNTDV